MPRGNSNFNPYKQANKRFRGNFYTKRNAEQIMGVSVTDTNFVPLNTNSDEDDDNDFPHRNNIIRNNENGGRSLNYNNFHMDDDDDEDNTRPYRGRNAYLNNPFHYWDTYFCDEGIFHCKKKNIYNCII